MILPNNTRAGFFIGDAAGVGKGRQVIMLECVLFLGMVPDVIYRLQELYLITMFEDDSNICGLVYHLT